MGESLTGTDEALAALERGGVVVIPTDTVYGVAARADRPAGIDRIFELKRRPSDKAVQLLVAGQEWLERFGQPSQDARMLARRYWPGPLTIVVRASPEAPDGVVSSGTLGLRAPAHPLTLDLITRSGPLAASSANRSGEATPPAIDSIHALFGDAVDVYLDGGHIEGAASTVVDTTGSEAVILREGAIPGGEITRALKGGFEVG